MSSLQNNTNPLVATTGLQATFQASTTYLYEGQLCYLTDTIQLATADSAGNKITFPRLLFTQTATGTVANTTTETALTSTGVGSLTLPAAYFIAGKTLKLEARGIHSAVSSPTLRIKVKLGSTVVLDTTAITTKNDTNEAIIIEAMITCRTTGASGTIFAQGLYTELGTGAV